MRISGIDFPTGLVNALRDGKLVVFAGAGVSMGEPANLPDFKGLTEVIARGTGVERLLDEPEDRFLGRLRDRGVRVHALAAQELSKDGQKPTELHRDLLRLFPDGKSPRIVTTNFDRLFEEAAKQLLDSEPEVFRAPSLPLGSLFNGIVHVHGDLDHPGDMVLTDTEFGRAYLTEGWARRFLVDLFRSFSVLFVGYSHNDTVMNYLARALPLDETERRFALTAEDDSSQWQFLGIEPVIYSNPDGAHNALCEGVSGLANNVGRGVLEWQQRITSIAIRKPSFLDEEEVDLIDDALSDATRTRFFTATASDSEWIDWLDRRGHLSNLFGTDDLRDHEKELTYWLATKFCLDYSNQLFRLVGRHNMRLHPEFWHQLGRTIGLRKGPELGADILARWVSVLIDSVPHTMPQDTVSTILLWLSERCIDHGLTDGLLDIFRAMSASRLVLRRWNEFFEPRFMVDNYEMNDVWEKGLKPNLDTLAEPLLMLVVENLRNQHVTLSTWGEDNRQWDATSWHRSAIEPHDQDDHPESLDVLIDAARDCLDHLALDRPVKAAYWCDLLVASEAPLLRRLAVHTLPQRNDLSVDGKIDWLLTSIGLHDVATHHETYQALRSVYPDASQGLRKAIVDAVLSFRWPDEEENEERLTAYHHFRWFDWLCAAVPECTIAKAALESVLSRHPDFKPGEHPDFALWSDGGSRSPTSPWSVQELLSRTAGEWLDDLLSFQGKELFGPDRWGLSSNVSEASTQNFVTVQSWGEVSN